MATVMDVTKSLIPISQFNKGQASRIFDRLHTENQLIVLKNNQPTAFILSPKEYDRLSEIEEDYYLLAEAYERLAAYADKAGIPIEKVMERHGITQEELDAMDEKRLEEQLKFILEADKEKRITRQTYNSDGVTKENDAEHAWHAALMTILLSEYANEPIDVLKTVKMLLLHDIVEIDAGDTYAYDEEAKKTQAAREEAAAERIYSLLPEDQGEELAELFREFNERQTPEAKFAHVMDNLQPMMLNDATGGKAWVDHDVHIGQIMARNEETHEGSEELWKYAKEHWLDKGVGNGTILP